MMNKKLISDTKTTHHSKIQILDEEKHKNEASQELSASRIFNNSKSPNKKSVHLQ